MSEPEELSAFARYWRTEFPTHEPSGITKTAGLAIWLAAIAAAEQVRVLHDSDPFCPKCGHNRDHSSVSSIDHQDGTRSCQMCGARWREVAALREGKP